MFDIFVSIVTNLFRLYVTKRFMELFFRKDEVNKNKELTVYFLFFGLTTVVHIIFKNPILNMLINLLGLYIITLVYESKHMIKVLVVALIYIINMVCDILSVFLLGNYNIGGTYEITAAFITVLLILLCELIIERILHRDQINVVDIKHWKILIIVPISSIIILCATAINSETNRIFTVIESVGILIINVVIFYVYGELKKYYFTLEENLFFKQRTEAYAAQLDILVETEKKMHALRHDMKHHLVEIGHLASMNDYARIMKYVNQMNEYIECQNIYVNSGNKDIDSILNYMLHIAAADGASIETNISIPEEINIKCFDLNVILGNLLDNAIEAIRKSDEKVLAININYEKGVLFINCKNSYTGEIYVEKGKILSSKRNKSMHGIGLDNIKKITEQYHGNVEVEYDNNYFDVTILLYTY